ncbi:MAG TPA: sulfotransferase [Mycobacteriales bacterium]|nr:sulfotransferase [Mycobacteriales bacterium]
MLPNFIIVGVSRGGTTTVFNTLSRHPQVLASSTKETRYFQPVRYGEPLGPISKYEGFFRRHSDQPIAMECTPDYFYGGERTARVIKQTCDPRVAIILREPASRLISFFQFIQGRLQLPATMTLNEYVTRCVALSPERADTRDGNNYTGLWGGQYARFLPAWLAAFPDRCDIFFFDDLRIDPIGLLGERCRRLGIDPTLLPATVPVDNSAPAYRSSGLQHAAAFLARRGSAVLRRYPSVYSRARGGYEAVNKREAPKVTVPEPLRREIEALYRPWNDQLREQLRDIGITELPRWLAASP